MAVAESSTAPPPQGDDEVAAVIFGEGRAFHHHIFQGIFHDLGKFGHFHARLFQLLQCAVIGTAHFCRLAAGHQQQSLFAGQSLIPKFVQCAGTEHYPGRIVKMKAHTHGYHSLLSCGLRSRGKKRNGLSGQKVFLLKPGQDIILGLCRT